MAVQQLLQTVEVAGRRLGDADVHHHRLDDEARDVVAALVQQAPQDFEIVERHDVRVPPQILRDPERHRRRGRLVAAAHEIGIGDDREHHRVVVTVVGPFDLDDVVAPGGGARHADRAHRRFGAGIREANLLELEPATQFLGQQHRVFGRSGEVRAVVGGARDGLDDLGMRVTDDHRPEAAMRVDVLVVVDVPDVAGMPLAQVERIGVADLERRPDAERHRADRALEEGARCRCVLEQPCSFVGGDLLGADRQGVVVHSRVHSFTITCLISV